MTEYGLQLYSVRDAMAKDLPATLSAVAKMGYAAVEFAGYFDFTAEKIKDILEDCNLQVWGTHTGLNALTPDKLSETLEFNRTIGNKNIVVPSAPLYGKGKLFKTLERLNELVPILKKEGFTLSYHNHSNEFRKRLFCPVPFFEMRDKTDVNFEIDTFWAYNAGVDPVSLLAEQRDRVRLIHLKDGKKGGEGKSLGLGEAPVVAVREAALRYDIPMIVESENLQPDGLSEVQRCIDFLKSLG